MLTGGIYEVYGNECLIQFVRVGDHDLFLAYVDLGYDVAMYAMAYYKMFNFLNSPDTKMLMQPSRPALKRLYSAIKDQITRQQSEYIRTGIRPEFKACDSILKDNGDKFREARIRKRNQLLGQAHCSENRTPVV